MSIIGESFESWVQTQIQVRQNLQGRKRRSNADLQVLSNQNAWLKLGSSVKVQANDKGRQRLVDIGFEDPSDFLGTGLAQKAILFNSLVEFNPDKGYTQRSGVISQNTEFWTDSAAYGLGGTDFGITPPPGIISADIKCKNRGSIREANVKIKAYNKFQFELLELLYLRLGYTMLLEWGNNKYYGIASVPVNPDNPTGDKKDINVYETTGVTLMERYWFEKSKAPFWDVIKEIYISSVKYQGNYDGFLGKVTNFDWNFLPDGSYDITLKLITVGDVIESLKVNLPQEVVNVGDVQKSIQSIITPESTGLKTANSAIITNAGDSTLSYSLYSDIVGPNQGKWDGSQGGIKTNYLSLLGLVGKELINQTDTNVQVGTQPQVPVVPSTQQGGNTIKYSFYLTFKELLLKVQKYVLPSINGDKILGINLSEDQICAIYPYQFSLDPRVAFIKPFFLDKFSYNTEDQYASNKTAGGTVGTGIINYYAWLQRVNNFGVQDDKCIYGNIMNIYLNYDFITTILAEETNEKGEIFLFKFLQKICNGINDALGGINNIECVLTRDRVIEFIEQNPIPGIEKSAKYKKYFKEDPVAFELYGYNPKNKQGVQASNFVRDFGFNTKLGPDIASSITIGATAEGTKTKNYDGTAFSKWNEGLEDRFATEYDDPQTPPLLEIPTTGSATEVEPLTLDQVGKLSEAFDAVELDKYRGVDSIDEFFSPVFGWLMERDQVTTSWGGLTKDGKKYIESCPVTSENYNAVTWEEYGELVRAKVQSNAMKNEAKELDKDDTINFIAYCANAFGGKLNTLPIVSPNYFKFDDTFISVGKNSFKGWVNTISNKVYEETGEPSNTIGFIPIDLNIKCDGISGIKIYNQLAVRQEFLPKQYPRALKFIISQVNHKIENNDWSTELQTISTANTKNTELTAETFKLVEYDLSDKDLLYESGLFAGAFTGPGTAFSGNLGAGDIRDQINPNKYGKKRYKHSPLAQFLVSKGVTNGVNAQMFPFMTDTGEKGNDRNTKFNNGVTNWYLFSICTQAWQRWKADALASGYKIGITNGYRSQEYQADFGNSSSAAKPGSSPHGFGAAVDVNIRPVEGKTQRGQSRFKYSGTTGAGAMSDRVTQDWKVVASIGARYGFFNPYRLANNTGAQTLDEAWHFEYWGPATALPSGQSLQSTQEINI